MTEHRPLPPAEVFIGIEPVRKLSESDVTRLLRPAQAAGFNARPMVPPQGGGAFRPTGLAGGDGAAPGGPAFSTAGSLVNPVPGAEAPDADDRARAAQEEQDALRAEGYALGLAEGHEQGRAEGRAAGRAEGHAAGHAQGLAEAEAALGHARRLFETAAARLTAPDPSDLGALSGALTRAIAHLASQRAGQQIDIAPGPFLARIEALADRVAQGLRDVTIRLNPADLEAIEAHLHGSPLLQDNRLKADPRLARGDTEIHAEGIALSDLLADLGTTDERA